MTIDLTGKTAVVTGGANGIGLAIAQALADCGAEVWIFDLEHERPADVAGGFGGRGCVADVTDRASLEAAFGQCSPPHVVAVNAGGVAYRDIIEHRIEDWNRILAVNLTGAFHTVQIAAHLMKQHRGGSIVLTASTNSYDGEPNLTAYNASKAGLLGLLHTAAGELGPWGIRVNAVCPGLIETRLTQDAFHDLAGLKEYFRHLPLGRGGRPEEVARAVAFLASDLASYITGATLFIDGGQMSTKFGTWKEDWAEFRDGRWQPRDR